MSRRKPCRRAVRKPGCWWGIGEFKRLFAETDESVQAMIAVGALEYSRSRVRLRYDGQETFGSFRCRAFLARRRGMHPAPRRKS